VPFTARDLAARCVGGGTVGNKLLRLFSPLLNNAFLQKI
jgi:hypothetical protein